ncbi:MAG: hypothetical protein K9K64_14845 [Desulfohalobiaceae bacterium]|nr:hypothetical protein [Desulfohalobiaceae bacterium]
MINKDLREFLQYIGSMWGILGGATVLFPLADVLFQVIPLPVDPYQKSVAPVAIPLTSLTALFILLSTFVQRYQTGLLTARRSGKYFAVGMVSLILFFLLDHFEYPLRAGFFPGLDSTDDYTLLLVGVVPFYIIFFAAVTRAFAILALIEFQRDR